MSRSAQRTLTRAGVGLVLGLAAASVPMLLAQTPAPEAGTKPPDAPAPRPRRVDPRADELVRKMSDLLARSPRFAFEAEETFDETSDNAPRVQLSNLRRVGVERPARFAADATGDTLNRAAWYDGKTLSVLNTAENRYVTVEMPDTIDEALDTLAERYGIVVPLSDFLYSDVYATLMEGVVYGEYEGLHQAGGVLCHHLAFSQDEIDWQIWIDAGDEPLPRKLVVNYVNEPGEPQYAAVIRRFSLVPKFPEGLFRFEAPEGAVRIEPAEMLRGQPAPAPAGAAKEEKR